MAWILSAAPEALARPLLGTCLPMPVHWPDTAGKLFLGFGTLTFAATAWFTLAGLGAAPRRHGAPRKTSRASAWPFGLASAGATGTHTRSTR